MLFGAVGDRAVVAVRRVGFSRLRIVDRRRGCCWSPRKIYFTGVTLARARLAARQRAQRGASPGCRSARDGRGAGDRRAARSARVAARHRRRRPIDALSAARPSRGQPACRASCCGRSWRWRGRCSRVARPYLSRLAWAAAVMLRGRRPGCSLSDEAFQEAVARVAERRSQEPAKKGAPSYTRAVDAAGRWRRSAGPRRRSPGRRRCRRCGWSTSAALAARRRDPVRAHRRSRRRWDARNGLASLLGAFALAGTVFAIAPGAAGPADRPAAGSARISSC